jgi:hypothetical protein
MSESKKFCYNCEVELNAENTSEFDGFDGSNQLSAKSVGLEIPAEFFTKCDDCFNADIDRHLDNQYN